MALKQLDTTTNFSIFFDEASPADLLLTAPGVSAQSRARAILNTCEADLMRLAAIMGAPTSAYGTSNRIKINLTKPTINPEAAGENNGYNLGGQTFSTLLPRLSWIIPGVPDDAIRGTFVAELAEVLNSERNK